MLQLVIASLLVGLAAAADPIGSPRSREAMTLCNRADDVAADEGSALLERSIRLAEQALAEDDRDALAHFAVFCVVGRQARKSGLSPLNLWRIRRLRKEIDRTLELAPDYPGALLGKGALLLNLPRLLGGDKEEGERLVRRALVVDPDFIEARLELARALAACDRREEARAEALAAARSAERDGEPDQAAEARRLADELGG